MSEVVVVEAIRTASGRGRPGGALSGVHSVDLLATVLSGLVERAGIDPGLVDDVMAGCVSQYREQSMNVARSAALAAGWPDSVPGTTIDRQCGSSQQALMFAAQSISAGMNEIVVACGVESMSRVPMGSPIGGADPYGSKFADRFPEGLVGQGVAADLVAQMYGLDRDALDEYAERSHRLADLHSRSGAFDNEILAVDVEVDGQPASHMRDETIRPGTAVEKLAGLKPVFKSDEMVARFPDLTWNTTAGNSSPLTDGASGVLLMSEEAASRLGLRPRARLVASAVCGDDPTIMLTAPIPATRMALKRAGLNIDDLDSYEVNEAFAPVPLAWAQALGADIEKLNPRGGAIALGHPMGASGTRIFTTMLHHLEQTKGRYGLQTMCEAGGMANATIIERI